MEKMNGAAYRPSFSGVNRRIEGDRIVGHDPFIRQRAEDNLGTQLKHNAYRFLDVEKLKEDSQQKSSKRVGPIGPANSMSMAGSSSS